ncbi:MAG: carboxypeptidase-like regulatory domain-containing protein, partial [Bacillota bacterium]
MLRKILKKKSLHWLVLLAMLVGMFPVPTAVGATTGDNAGIFTTQTVTGPVVSLEASKKWVRPGEDFEVSLTVTNATYLVGGSLDLAFNPNLATLTGLQKDDMFGNLTDAVYQSVYGYNPIDNSADWLFDMVKSVSSSVYRSPDGLLPLPQDVNALNSNSTAIISYVAAVMADSAQGIYPSANTFPYNNNAYASSLVTLTFSAQSAGQFPIGLLANMVNRDALNNGQAMAKLMQEIPTAPGATRTEPVPMAYTITPATTVEIIDASGVGHVYDAAGTENNLTPLGGVKVEAVNQDNTVAETVYTNDTGWYQLPSTLAAGTYNLRFSKDGYKTGTQEDIIFSENNLKIIDEELAQMRTITGAVYDRYTDNAISGASIAAFIYGQENPVATATTATDGSFTLGPLGSDESYELDFTANGYQDYTDDIYLPPGDTSWDYDAYLADFIPHLDYIEPGWAIENTTVPITVYGENLPANASSVTLAVYRTSAWMQEPGQTGNLITPEYIGQATVNTVSSDAIHATISGLTRGWYHLQPTVNDQPITLSEELEIRPAGIGVYPSWDDGTAQVLPPGYTDSSALYQYLNLFNTSGNETFQVRLSPRDSDVLMATPAISAGHNYYGEDEHTRIDYTIPQDIATGTYKKWLVVNGTAGEQKLFIGYLVVGEPAITWVSPLPVPGNLPDVDIHIGGNYFGDKNTTTFYVYNSDGNLALTTTPADIYPGYDPQSVAPYLEATLNISTETLQTGYYDIIAQVGDVRSAPFRVKVEDSGRFIVNWQTSPPVQKAGVSSFDVTLEGFKLQGTTYKAKLVTWDDYGNQKVIASGSSVKTGQDNRWEYLTLHMDSVTGKIYAGDNYFVQVTADDQSPVQYLDIWGPGVNIQFTADKAVYYVDPGSVLPQTANQQIKIYGWNLGTAKYLVSVTKPVNNTVTEVAYGEAVPAADHNGYEYLQVTLPPLPEDYYDLVVAPASNPAQKIADYGNLWLNVAGPRVHFDLPPWGGTVTSEVYHQGNRYYADAFDIIAYPELININGQNITASLRRWDGSPAVLGAIPLQTVSANVYATDNQLTLKVPEGLWVGGYVIDVAIGTQHFEGAFSVGNAPGRLVVTNTFPKFIEAGISDVYGGMQIYGLNTANGSNLRATLVDKVYGNEVATSAAPGYGVFPGENDWDGATKLDLSLKVASTNGLAAGNYNYKLWSGDQLQDMRTVGLVTATVDPFLWGWTEPGALLAGSSSYSLKLGVGNIDNLTVTQMAYINVKLYDRHTDALLATSTDITKDDNQNGHKTIVASFNEPIPTGTSKLKVVVTGIEGQQPNDVMVVTDEPWVTEAHWGATYGTALEINGYNLDRISPTNINVVLKQNGSGMEYIWPTVTGIVYGVIKATGQIPQGDYDVSVEYKNSMDSVPGNAYISYHLPPSAMDIQIPQIQETVHGQVYSADAFNANITAVNTDWTAIGSNYVVKVFGTQGQLISTATVTRDVYIQDKLVANVPAGLLAGNYRLEVRIGDRMESRDFAVSSAYPVITSISPWATAAG